MSELKKLLKKIEDAKNTLSNLQSTKDAVQIEVDNLNVRKSNIQSEIDKFVEDANTQSQGIINAARGEADRIKQELDNTVNQLQAQINTLTEQKNNIQNEIITILDDARKKGEEALAISLTEAENKANEIKMEAQRQADQFISNNKELVEHAVKEAINDLVNEAKEEVIGPYGKEVLEKIQQVQVELEKAKELFNIQKLKERILEETEKVCEEYLATKVQGIEQIGFKVIPDVELTLDNTTLKIELTFYLMLLEDAEGNPIEKYIIKLTMKLKYDLTQPQNVMKVLESAEMKADFNENWIKEKGEEFKKELEQKIKEKQEEILVAFAQSILPEAFVIFNKFKRIIPSM